MNRNKPVELLVVQRSQGLTSSERSHAITTMIYEATKRSDFDKLTILVVTDSPKGTHSVVSKHWHKLERKLEKEKASTVEKFKRELIEGSLDVMGNLAFSVGCPEDGGCGVFFVAPEHPFCAAMGGDIEMYGQCHGT